MIAAQPDGTRGTAELLALKFDRSFARRPPQDQAATDDYLAIRAGCDAYALRIGEIVGLALDRPLIAFRCAARDFLGLAGVRGGVVAVYSLRGLLGAAESAGVSRWLALLSGDVALAFDQLDGQVRVPRSELLPASDTHAARRHITAAIRSEDVLRPILGIGSLVKEIESRVGRPST